VALDEVGLVAVALHQLGELVLRDAREEAGVGDLVAVQVQDRQHAAVARRAQELVAVPPGGERAGLRLAVSDDACDDQIGVVERRAVRVGQRITELAALVDRARRLGRDVARNAAREAELFEQLLHPVFVLLDVRVDLAVGPFEIGMRHERRTAVPGADHVDHVEIESVDDAIQVRVEEVQARRGAPVTEQARLDVLARERLLEQRIVEQVDLPEREVVRSAPERVDVPKFALGECGRGLALALRRGGGHWMDLLPH
jgi:hypothetical protein